MDTATHSDTLLMEL